MSYLLIDSDDYAAAGIETFMFPGGEPHVKIPELYNKDFLLYLKLRTWEDVGYAALLLDAIAEQCDQRLLVADELPTRNIFIPYFPGARQDRTDGNSPITVRLMAILLARADETFTFDLHSEAAKNWFLKAGEHFTRDILSLEVLMPCDLDLSTMPYYKGVIAPDKGAVERAKLFAGALPGNPEIVICDKERDFQSGKITRYVVPEMEPGHYLVVDDICDGGATFNMLADSVKQSSEYYRVTLDLWVSHGIFSKGLAELNKRYERIYTTDSFYRPNSFAVLDDAALAGNPGVTVFSLKQLFDKIMES